jgi:GntR family transcriptional regulator
MAAEIDVIDRMLADLHAGTFRPNDKLPSENELADEMRLPRMVVRKAYERLQEMGYIYSLQGRGSFVRDRRTQIPLTLRGDESFSVKMRELGMVYDSRNLGCVTIAYQQNIYETLGVTEDERVFRIERLRVVDHQPIALHVSFVAERVFPQIERQGNTITSMFHFYAEQGYQAFDSFKTVFSIVFPTKEERDSLQCSSLIPLLVLESGCIDRESGQVLEMTRISYRTDRFKYVM